MRLLTLNEVGIELNRSPKSIRRYTRDGLLHPVYILNRPQYRSDEIEKIKSVGLNTPVAENNYIDRRNTIRRAGHNTRKYVWQA
jgi:hypothetical protein